MMKSYWSGTQYEGPSPYPTLLSAKILTYLEQGKLTALPMFCCFRAVQHKERESGFKPHKSHACPPES